MKELLEKLSGENERVGFILKDGTIVEVDNVHPQPTRSFLVTGKDLKTYLEKAAATWHTHPGATNNLSVADHESFLRYPDLRHFIVGTDGVREYYVEDQDVIVA